MALWPPRRGKKLSKQEERHSRGVWGREVEKRWRGKKDNRREVRTERKTFPEPKSASCITHRSKAWAWTELIWGQRSDGYMIHVYFTKDICRKNRKKKGEMEKKSE